MGSGLGDSVIRLLAKIMTKASLDAKDYRDSQGTLYGSRCLETSYDYFKEKHIADKIETQMFIDALEGREELTDPDYGKPFSQTIVNYKKRDPLIEKRMEEYKQFTKDIVPKIESVKKKINEGIVTFFGEKITVKTITPGILLWGYFCLEQHRIPNIDYCHMGKYNILFPMHDKIWSVFLNEDVNKIMESRINFFEFIRHLESRDQTSYMPIWKVTTGAPENPISKDGKPSRQFLESMMNYDCIIREHHDMSREVIFVSGIAYYFLKHAKLIDRTKYCDKFIRNV